MTSFKKLWADPVGSKLISNFIWAMMVVAGGYAIFHWREPFIASVIRLWRYVLADTLVSRPVLWGLILWFGLTVTAGGVYLVKRLRNSVPPWKNYTEDEFQFMQWRWKLTDDATPYDMRAFCPACDYELNITTVGHYLEPKTRYTCNCGKTSQDIRLHHDSVLEQVTKMIQQRIRTEGWRQAKRR